MVGKDSESGFLQIVILSKNKVGVAGLEPATSCSQSKRASQLCYTPKPDKLTISLKYQYVARGLR